MATAVGLESTSERHATNADLRPTGACATCAYADCRQRRIAALRSAVQQARELGRDRVFALTPREAKAALRQAIAAAQQYECTAHFRD